MQQKWFSAVWKTHLNVGWPTGLAPLNICLYKPCLRTEYLSAWIQAQAPHCFQSQRRGRLECHHVYINTLYYNPLYLYLCRLTQLRFLNEAPLCMDQGIMARFLPFRLQQTSVCNIINIIISIFHNHLSTPLPNDTVIIYWATEIIVSPFYPAV